MSTPAHRPSMMALLGLILAAGGLAGCHRRAATADDCRAVLERLIQLELAESGFRDPVLAARWTGTLDRELAPQLNGCVGRRVPIAVRACVAGARTAEEIAHRCLK